jgi:CubicO group peptidase (beta-lactamase class C family)
VWTKRRLIRTAVAATGVVVVGALVVAVAPLIALATAYKAQMLCSEVFILGRRADDAAARLAIDDLRLLRWIGTSVDTQWRVVQTRVFPLAARRARYDRSFGCVLEQSDGRRVGRPPSKAEPSRANPTVDSIAALPATNRAALNAALDDAFSEPDSSHSRRTRAVVVIQHGAIVAERYADGFGPETPFIGWSMTKSVVNALVGVAVGEGILKVDAPVPLRAWKTSGDPRARITVSDLLHMSSGLRFDEREGDPSSDVLRMLFREADMAAFASAKPLAANPGSHWRYSSGTTVILSRALREALGDSSYWMLPYRALFEPLGMNHALIETDASGTFVGSSYMYATAREWGRFGRLYLQDGVWQGRRILPAGWVDYSRTPARAAPGGIYGAHFWLSTPKEYRGPPVPLPSGIFQAVGHEGQFVTIVPSRDVVIVRLGRTRNASAWSHDPFVAAVLEALPP